MTEIYKCPVAGCGQIAEHEFYCTRHGGKDLFSMPVSVLIADASDRQRIAELEQQLSAMTTERDAAVRRCREYALQIICVESKISLDGVWKVCAFGRGEKETVSSRRQIEHRNWCIVAQARKETIDE